MLNKSYCIDCGSTFAVLPTIRVGTRCSRCTPAFSACGRCGNVHIKDQTICCTHCAAEIRADAYRRLCSDCLSLPLDERLELYTKTFSIKVAA